MSFLLGRPPNRCYVSFWEGLKYPGYTNSLEISVFDKEKKHLQNRKVWKLFFVQAGFLDVALKNSRSKTTCHGLVQKDVFF